MALKDELMDIEQGVVEVLGELIQEFDRNYSELSETNKAHYNAYFTQVSTEYFCAYAHVCLRALCGCLQVCTRCV